MANMITQYGLDEDKKRQGKKDNSEWEKMLQQARLAMSMDGQTALGFALGKGLRYLWDQHLKRRHDRQRREADSVNQANGQTAPVVAPAAENPAATGAMWEMYSQANSLPGSRDYVGEALAGVMPDTNFHVDRPQEVTNATELYIDATGTPRNLEAQRPLMPDPGAIDPYLSGEALRRALFGGKRW